MFIIEGIAFFKIRLFLEFLPTPIPFKLTMKVAEKEREIDFFFFFLMKSFHQKVLLGEEFSISGDFYTLLRKLRIS